MNKTFIKYITILLGVEAIWTLVLPFLFSHAFPVVCENINANSDYFIEVKNPHIQLSVLPTVKFHAEEFKIKNNKTDNYLNLTKPDIKIRLLPLISGRIHINRIFSEDLEIKYNIQDDMYFDKSILKKLQNTKISCDQLLITQSKIYLAKHDVKEPIYIDIKPLIFKKNYHLLEVQSNFEILSKDLLSSAKFNLYLEDHDKTTNKLNIALDNFNLTSISPYIKTFLPKGYTDIVGIVNLNTDHNNINAKLVDFEIKNKDLNKTITFPKELNVNSDFSITNHEIDLKKVQILSNNINTILKGKILNYTNLANTLLNLNLSINKSNVEDISKLLPPIIIEDLNLEALKKYNVFGDILGNISIKGNINEPNVNGNVLINNLVLEKPIPYAKGATIKLDFSGKHLNFDVKVPAGKLETVWVNGGVELYNIKYSDMRIWSTKKVDLELAEEKIIPVHEVLNFLIGPVPIMDITGKGNIDIIVKGNKKDPHIWGALNVNNATARFKEMPDFELKNADAILTFDNQNAIFQNTKGFVNHAPINISGKCNLFGDFDFDVKSEKQELSYLYNAIKTSTLINEIKEVIPEIENASGLVDLTLKIYGSIKDINDIKYNKNFFTKGSLELFNNQLSIDLTKYSEFAKKILPNINVYKTRGIIAFDNNNFKIDLTSNLNSSNLLIKGEVKNDLANFEIKIPTLNLKDLSTSLGEIQNDFGDIILNFIASYKGSINNIELNKLNFDANIIYTNKNNKVNVKNGLISLKNGNLKINNLTGYFKEYSGFYDIKLLVDNLFSNPSVNGYINLKDFDLRNINKITNYPIYSKDVQKILQEVSFTKGKINTNIKLNNNNMNAYSDLGGINFIYNPLEMPINIINGSLILRNDDLRLNKLNILADDMPILIDGKIQDIYSKQLFNIFLNSKPMQTFIDKYINKNQIYPMKIKGDIVYSTSLKGTKNDLDLVTNINMSKDSSIYYLGATVGDVENAINVLLDMNIYNDIINIHEFSYDKMIESNKSKLTKLNLLKSFGEIKVLQNDLAFNNLAVKTKNPTDARIFNIIFRKPNIKQGQFTSDLKINGKLSEPKFTGNFHIFETNIPFLDTTLKNISFLFNDKNIEINSIGEVLGNDVTSKVVMRNKLNAPYYIDNFELNSKTLDLNYIINKFKISEIDTISNNPIIENLDFSQFIIKNMLLNLETVKLRQIVASNVVAKASLNDKKIFKIHKFQFDTAKGNINGDYQYNLNNNDVKLNLHAKDIDANDLSSSLFDINNQIYGDLTGNTKLSCNGTNFEKCLATLDGFTSFNVINGRMPKLGSLEYLLKAGNLVKGGFTGVSINSIIDLIAPLKTGYFSNIYGTISMKDGIANDIQIATKGNDLSLYITGNYNFTTSIAEMEILGLLSKNISTVFGPVGNLSLNTLFNIIPGVNLTDKSPLLDKINKIPGIELSTKEFRKFIAEINGNINSENYVKSFKWIN